MRKNSWKKIGIVLFFGFFGIFFYFLYFNDNGKATGEKQKGGIKITQIPPALRETRKIRHEWPADVSRHTENQNIIPNNQNDTENTSTYEDLIGLVNDDNLAYRSEYYSRLDYELAKKQMEEANDQNENIVEQFENSINYSLGTDFPEEKRIKMREAQRDMLYKKELLDKKAGEFSKEKYTGEIVAYHNEYLSIMAAILTEEEFEALFQIKKDESKNVLMKIISIPKQE